MGTAKRRNTITGWLLVLPLTAGCAVFMVIPFLELLKRSFTTGMGAGLTFVGLKNYSALLRNEFFRQAVENTLTFLSLSLPLVFFFAFAFALFIHRKRRKALLQTAALLPYVMPVVGTVAVLDLLFPDTASLAGAATIPAVVGLYLWKNTGYTMLILAAGLTAIPPEHYESAQIDGASSWQQLCLITVPQMWDSFFYSVVFSMMNIFKCFREIFLLGGKHPPRGLYMLQHFLNNCFENLNFSKLSCCAVVLLLALAVPFCLAYRWVARREV